MIGHFLFQSCLNKIQRFHSKLVKFITIYATKNSLVLIPTKINFLLYLVVILYTRSPALVVEKPILASQKKDVFLYVCKSTQLGSLLVQWDNIFLIMNMLNS